MIYMPPWNKMSSTVIFIWVLVFISSMLSCVLTSVTTRYKTCRLNVPERGCPQYDYIEWNCLKDEASCPQGTEYHCCRLHSNHSRYADGCAISKECSIGEMPYLEPSNDGILMHVICDWCHNKEYFNPRKKVSSTYDECPDEKVICDHYHGIECLPKNKDDTHKQNRLCRCDARNDYVFNNLERLNGEVCTSRQYLAADCILAKPCKDGQERLLNYTCVNKCKNGNRSDTSDECRPFNALTENTGEPFFTVESKSMKEKTLSTISSTKITSPPASAIISKVFPSLKPKMIQTTKTPNEIRSTSYQTVIIVLAVICVILIVVLFIVCWKIGACKRWRSEQIYTVLCRRRRSDDTPSTSEMDTTRKPLIKKEYYYEVQICVTNVEYTPEMDRVDVARLPITEKLENTMLKALSDIPAVTYVRVTKLSKGSLIVIFVIKTENISSHSDLEKFIKNLLEGGTVGDFTVSLENFKFKKYPDLAPLPRRPSVQVMTIELSPSIRPRSLRRANSEPNGHYPAPLADHEISLLGESAKKDSTDVPLTVVIETEKESDSRRLSGEPFSKWPNLTEEQRNFVAIKALNSLFTLFVNDLLPNPILDQFFDCEFLADADIRNIVEQKTTSDQNRMIIAAVKRKGYKGYEKFKSILKVTQFESILGTLERKEEMIAEDIKAHPEKYQSKDGDSDN